MPTPCALTITTLSVFLFACDTIIPSLEMPPVMMAPTDRSHALGSRQVRTPEFVLSWGGEIPAPTSWMTQDHVTNHGLRLDRHAHRWDPIPIADAPSKRRHHSAVWTGSHMLIWGGQGTHQLPDDALSDGAAYDPHRAIWTPIDRTSAPLARYHHSAVWTGETMVVWGGLNPALVDYRIAHDGSLDHGALYDPVSKHWTSITTLGAPSPRYGHVAAWTGDEMIILGGQGIASDLSYSGAHYDPAMDRWRPSPASPMSLAHAVAAWTGHALVVWSDAGLAFYHPGHQDWEQVELTGNMQQLNWWQRGLSVDSGQLILWGKSHHGPWRLARYHLNHQQWEDWELEAAATNTAIWSGDELWLFRAQTESTLTR